MELAPFGYGCCTTYRQSVQQMTTQKTRVETASSTDFIRAIIESHNESGRFEGKVVTRFPPEPNGYLHIGHTKAAFINFGIAKDYRGVCHLRFDDTNPAKEEEEFVRAIQEDLRWLGLDWGDHLYYASDYFERLYEFGEHLIKTGLAYVCDLSQDEIREHRGTFTEPGIPSPYRDRSLEENLDLFRRMRAGEFGDGARVLRARIDMASGNLNLRDPVLYRILHLDHQRTGDEWCIYPTYDFAHGQSDSIEGITHSLCSLEFEDHRPLYDWLVEKLGIHHPQQIEFARLNLTHTVMSKRKLRELVAGGYVSGWDDPRMPTLSAMRRRGYTPEALWTFNERLGIAKRPNTVEIQMLEHCVREDLNRKARRVMGVLHPLRLVIENYPEGQVEQMEAVNNPEDASMGTRKVPFSRVLYVEREDFMEDPPRKFYRLGPGREVRLRYAYLVTCVGFTKDEETGEVTEVRCTYDPETRGGNAPDGRRVRGTIHWVSAEHAMDAEVRLYDHLFTVEKPEEGDFVQHLNPNSLVTLEGCKLEPGMAAALVGTPYQFERIGYFCVDGPDSKSEALVFNRTVALRDSWGRRNRGRRG